MGFSLVDWVRAGGRCSSGILIGSELFLNTVVNSNAVPLSEKGLASPMSLTMLVAECSILKCEGSSTYGVFWEDCENAVVYEDDLCKVGVGGRSKEVS